MDEEATPTIVWRRPFTRLLRIRQEKDICSEQMEPKPQDMDRPLPPPLFLDSSGSSNTPCSETATAPLGSPESCPPPVWDQSNVVAWLLVLLKAAWTVAVEQMEQFTPFRDGIQLLIMQVWFILLGRASNKKA
jgi:hypothetical protein